MQLKPSAILQNGKYRIESVLGQGGFGITYLAVQAGLNRRVAIKEFFMKDLCERDEDTSHVSVPSSGSRELVEKFKAKFIKEAQTIADLKHPNIIRIYDVFEENGTAYYVMEYHDAGSLSSQSLPMSPESVISYAKQISSALAYLHKRKVMHLDVKPANVLIDDDGNAVLIDFGVSKRYDEEGHQTSSTPVGISHGYAPIEQYSQSTLTFSPATDIYALGATLYKLLTGQTPPESSLLLSNPSLLSFPEGVPASLVALVRKCMRPIVDDRPKSMEEFLELLEAAEVAMKAETENSEGVAVEDETYVSVPDSGSTSDGPSGPAPRKRRLWLWVTLLAFVVGVVGAVVFSGKEADAPAVSAEQAGTYALPVEPVVQEPSVDYAAEEKERTRFESDYNDYKNAMEMGSAYAKIESTLSKAKSEYESALKIEQSWSGNSAYSSRFNLNASSALKRVEKRLDDIAAAEAAAKKKAEEEAKKKAEEAKRVAEAKSLGGSANCYIVSSSGSYKFRTVKGNSSTSVGSVASAEVLWESFGTSTTPSKGDLIKSVSYKDGNIYFDTAATFKEGNAVIAVKNSSGTILWSWHIWFTDQPQGQEYDNNAGTMMDRNLGATSATPGDVGALGLLYQWGRKDPFLGSSSISSGTLAKSTITWPSAVSSNSSNGTISYATANPTTFITNNSSNEDWYYTGDESTDNTRWTTSDKAKSIYDPCPAGWRVPDGGSNGVWAKAGFNDTTYNSTNKGISFNISSPSTTWYPASGFRSGSDGSLALVGIWVYYCSASPYSFSRNLVDYLYFNDNGSVVPSLYYYRAGGFSVRCLQAID